MQWSGDHHWLGAVETDDLYDNTIHSAIECVLYVYLEKECDKAFRKKIKALEGQKNLLLEEGQRLKARVNEVEGIIKETLESVDKFQVDLDEANASKATLEIKAKVVEDQVVKFQRQV